MNINKALLYKSYLNSARYNCPILQAMVEKYNFIVVNIKGRKKLHEIAVIDNKEKLIYEAFAEEYAEQDEVRLNRKPLQQIITYFANTAKNKLILCHFAQHDIKVFKNSFKKVGRN